MLREANEADVEAIRQWRNHPKVRGASIWIDFITPEGHARWWARVQADPARRVLIFEYRDIPCGVVTFNAHDKEAGTAEWGFFLDVAGLDSRGELLPAWIQLEKAAVNYAFDEMKLKAVGGRTLECNKQVIALHRRFGFAEVPERRYKTTIRGEERVVIWTELTADERSL